MDFLTAPAAEEMTPARTAALTGVVFSVYERSELP